MRNSLYFKCSCVFGIILVRDGHRLWGFFALLSIMHIVLWGWGGGYHISLVYIMFNVLSSVMLKSVFVGC